MDPESHHKRENRDPNSRPLHRKAEAFLTDRSGCPDNPWINKRACVDCLEDLLLDVWHQAMNQAHMQQQRVAAKRHVIDDKDIA